LCAKNPGFYDTQAARFLVVEEFLVSAILNYWNIVGVTQPNDGLSPLSRDSHSGGILIDRYQVKKGRLLPKCGFNVRNNRALIVT
jgi:hypothetical protein